MPIKIPVYNKNLEAVGEEKLPESIFGLEMNEDLVHQAFTTQRSNERQVIAHTKGRAEVRGGGKKPWRQKGTGRARAGSNRSPIWRGGGVTFGPSSDRNFKKKLNKKMKQKAINIVLSDRVKNNNFVILDKVESEQFKTKPIEKMLSQIEKKLFKQKDKKRSIVFVDNPSEEKTKFSIRNLSGVKYLNIDNINIVDLLTFRNLVISRGSLEKIINKKQDK